MPTADLALIVTDGRTSVVAGTATIYTLTVANLGPDPVTGAGVSDQLSAGVTAVTWTAVGAGGGTPAHASGSSSIAETVDLPAGGSVTYTVSVQVDPSAIGHLVNTATISTPGGRSTQIPAITPASTTIH